MAREGSRSGWAGDFHCTQSREPFQAVAGNESTALSAKIFKYIAVLLRPSRCNKLDIKEDEGLLLLEVLEVVVYE